MRSYGWAAGLLLFLFGGTSLQAQVAEQSSDTSQAALPADPTAGAPPSDPSSEDAQAQAVDDEKKWKFATLGYAWLAGAHGKTDVIGPVPPVDLDLSFGDVLKALKFVFMGAAEARRDRLVFLGDIMFVHMEAKRGIGIRDPDFLEAELDSRTAAITLIGGYRVAKDGPVKVDILGGGRMNFSRTSLQLDGPVRSAEGSVKQTWLDPVIATRMNAPLGEKWNMVLYGDVGGVLFGSDFSWQGIATVNYQLNRKMTLGAGWRHYKVNYDKGDFLYDVAQSGPIIIFRTEL